MNVKWACCILFDYSLREKLSVEEMLICVNYLKLSVVDVGASVVDQTRR